jgi:hypothetical protein
MVWSFNCFPIHDLIGSISNLLKLEYLGSILIGGTVSFLSGPVSASGVVSSIGTLFNFIGLAVETLGLFSLLPRRLGLRSLLILLHVVPVQHHEDGTQGNNDPTFAVHEN